MSSIADVRLSWQVYGLPTVMIFKNGVAVEGSKREGKSMYTCPFALPTSHCCRIAPLFVDRADACPAGALSKDKLIQHLAVYGVLKP